VGFDAYLDSALGLFNLLGELPSKKEVISPKSDPKKSSNPAAAKEDPNVVH